MNDGVDIVNLLEKDIKELDDIELRCVIRYLLYRYDKIGKDIKKFKNISKVADTCFCTGLAALLVSGVVGDGIVKNIVTITNITLQTAAIAGNLYLISQSEKRANLENDETFVIQKLQEADDELKRRIVARGNEILGKYIFPELVEKGEVKIFNDEFYDEIQ